MILLAIDPGVSTGVAVRIDNTYSTCTLTDPDELWDMLKQFKPNLVAFESFATGGRVDRNMLHTIELVGSIRGVCFVLGIPAYGQQPQTRRAFIQDAQVLLKGQAGKTEHETDALAHLLLLEWRIKHNKL